MQAVSSNFHVIGESPTTVYNYNYTYWGGETVPLYDDEQQNADAARRSLKRSKHRTLKSTEGARKKSGARRICGAGGSERWQFADL